MAKTADLEQFIFNQAHQYMEDLKKLPAATTWKEFVDRIQKTVFSDGSYIDKHRTDGVIMLYGHKDDWKEMMCWHNNFDDSVFASSEYAFIASIEEQKLLDRIQNENVGVAQR